MAKKKDKRNSTIRLIALKLQQPKLENNTLTYQGDITLREFSKAMKIKDYQIIKFFFEKGERLLVNGTMTYEQIKKYCNKFGINVIKTNPLSDEEIAKDLLIPIDKENAIIRNPIISILGHVDHGKTTLLDTIRNTNVVSKEKGKITQHIGAYIVKNRDKQLTFIDTPGHEAFIQMRRRGARATDISIIVVAADDGVKPQTIEAIKHAKDANVSIIVAINKIDKENIDIDKVKAQVAKFDLMPEEWGGDVPYVEISAKKNINVDLLLETIDAVAEQLNLHANLDRMASGIVIESHLNPHLGSVATLLVQNGVLKYGDVIVVGHIVGKVRQMVDEDLKVKHIAYPSTPIRISGLSDTPHVGDLFVCVKSEKEAKILSEYKKDLYLLRKKGLFSKVISQSGNKKVLNIIVRGDTQGSLEVLKSMITNYRLKNQHINILSMHVGKITQTDIDLASSTNSTIIAFNVGNINKEILSKIRIKNINFISDQIIYQIKTKLEELIVNSADEIITKDIIGIAEVKKVFNSSTKKQIAGCILLSGKVTMDLLCSLKRNKEELNGLKIQTLKRYKDNVAEVNNNQDFGLLLENINDFKIGDKLTFYKIQKSKLKINDLIENN